jgi:hypothetical protein
LLDYLCGDSIPAHNDQLAIKQLLAINNIYCKQESKTNRELVLTLSLSQNMDEGT